MNKISCEVRNLRKNMVVLFLDSMKKDIVTQDALPCRMMGYYRVEMASGKPINCHGENIVTILE